MSINHFSSDLPETLWWTQQQQPMMESTPNTSSSNQKLLIPQQNHLWPSQIYNPHHHQHQQWLGPFNSQEATPSMFHNRNTPLNFNLNEEDDEETEEQITDERENFHYQEHQQHHQQEEEIVEAEREPMFEKPLTPSDVGKLNRLVIPKQHAEKYFPLGGGGGGGDSTEKGLLLSFEDELGKCWRFRYSYWNSSQSYVLTKGWSRYVKEKRLDAGDVVLFERHRSDGDKLFIGWRRRAPQAQDSGAALQPGGGGGGGGGGGNIGGTSSGGWTRVFYSAHPYPPHPLPYQPDCLHAGSVGQSQTTPAGNWKRVRLFGVNLECQLHDDSEPPTPDGSSSSSQGGQTTHHQFYPEPPASAAHTPMDTNFSRDVNHMRNRRG